MYLKRLELKGFKSFADRTVFTFVPGITAIVGPNGSGKSNVTDAMRWVLGEQSAKTLRGAKMEDVIFAGSATRKPIGFCEVAITFDNSEQRLPYDYSEVTVTRRVYRSGESHYLLNHQPCRRKDIQELFLDTGIGKEAYSVIGQGRIDEILSTKSEDRRAIFEEAAGIVKYKMRKQEASKKLEQTEQNVARIRDLLYELNAQIEPLQQQAEKAKQYKSWQQELAEYEMALYVHKIGTLHQEWQETSKLVEKLTDQQVSEATALAKLQGQLESERQAFLQLEEQWERWQAALIRASEAVEKVEGQQRLLQERLNHQQEQQARYQQQFEQTQSELAALMQERQQVFEKIGAREAACDEAEQQLQELLHRLASLTNQDELQLAEWEESYQQGERQRLLLEQERRHLQEQQKSLQEEVEQTAQQLASWQAEQSALEEELAQTEKQQKAMSSQLEKWMQADHELEIRLLEQQKAEQQQLQAWQQSQQQVTRLRSRLESLQELQASHEGFFTGVKAALQARDRGIHSLQGIRGAVAELIHVDTAWEVAIETALGNALQHLVVEDEETGRSAIQYLKAKRLGRATFLPMDVIKGRQITAEELQGVRQQTGFVGLASQLVETEPDYRSIIDHLLGRVIVTQNLEQANSLARQLRYRYRVVTVEGDVVNPGGSMSGGSRQQNRPQLLGRQRQWKELEQQVARLSEQEQDRKEKWRASQAQQAHLKEEQDQLRQQCAQQRERLQGVQDKRREKQMAVTHLQEQQKRLRAQQQQQSEQQARLKDRQQQLQQQLEQMAKHLQELQQKIDLGRGQVAAQSETKASYQAELTEAKVRLAKCKQDVEHHKQLLARLDEQVSRLQGQKEEAKVQTMAVAEKQQQEEQQLQTIAEELKQNLAAKTEVTQQLQAVKIERQQLLEKREQQEAAVREAEKRVNEVQATLHQEEVRANRLDVELNHYLQKLAEEYEISYERAAEQVKDSHEPASLERQVRSLKQKINQLGEVNLGAIEEYDRLQERLQFLQAQETDLLEAKKRLYELIQQIEEEMGERFSKAFSFIREAFQEVFVQMFGGGRADLTLAEPDNLLTTGIDIVAQPPGKRLQKLSLLSGGERSLTAIALLFAVLRMKPVPFCVLDEVDAALDEVNLSRFTRYMRQIAAETQFILITHRKRTMEGADVLYGITMQESGVSARVAVEMKELASQREIAVTQEQEG